MYVKYINVLHLFLLDPRVVHNFAQSEILDKIETPIEQTELILNCWSEHYINRVQPLFEEIIKYKFKKIYLIVDTNSKLNFSQLSKSIQDVCELIVIDGMHMLSAQTVWGDRCLHSWNVSATKGFLPTGALDRSNRIRLLEKLYRANCLKNLIWTFPKGQHQKSAVVKYYKEFFNAVPDDLEEFYKYCSTNASTQEEGISTRSFTDITPGFLSYDHPLDLYQDSSFILVSETWDRDNLSPLITEKIPLAILNHRPFLLAGSVHGTIKRLQDYGFYTFADYLPYPDYDNVSDLEIRLDQLVENVKAFPNILLDNQEQIKKEIDYNFIRLNEIADSTREKLTQLAVNHNLTYSSLEEYFGLDPWVKQHYVYHPESGYSNSSKPDLVLLRKLEKTYLVKPWLDYYNTIKGHDWPELTDPNQFETLPENIKLECINVFNFDANTKPSSG